MVGTLVFVVLAVVSAGSVVAGEPWTARLSRRRYPRELWGDPLFLRTNRIVTVAWTVLFAAAAGVSAVGPAWTPIGCALVAGLLSPLSFRFGDWYSSRQLQSPVGIEDRAPAACSEGGAPA